MSNSLSARAYEELHAEIIEGRIAEEAVLSERILAESMGISRTPLRTALAQLESEGVVERLGNGVIIVRSVTVEKLIEIVRLRQYLESAAAERAASFSVPEDLRIIGQRMELIAAGEPTDFESFWSVDEIFHLEVSRAANLDLLPEILEEHRAIARRCSLTRTYDSFIEQAQEHVAIIHAIAAGDGRAAHAAMWHHFDQVRARFLETFAGQG